MKQSQNYTISEQHGDLSQNYDSNWKLGKILLLFRIKVQTVYKKFSTKNVIPT